MKGSLAMRILAAAALIASVLAVQAQAQAPTSPPPTLPVRSKSTAGSRSSDTIYKMVKTDGTSVLLRSFAKEGDRYEVVDFRRLMGSHPVASVSSIVELSDVDLAGELKEEAAKSPAPLGYRTAARTSARSSARTTARTTPEPEPFSFPSRTTFPTDPPDDDEKPPVKADGTAGYTATGIPLHVGPRGGVYHLSKSGKKVYQKKK